MAAGGLFKGLDGWDPAPLRKHLSKAGFHREGLETLGLPERWLRSAVPRAALLGRVEPDSPLETLVRLFTLGDAVGGDRALHALGDSVHGLLEIGFLAAGGGTVRSCYQIFPVDGGWFATDFHRRQGEDVDDYVMGVGPSSILLASLTPPLFGGKVLELACGIGWLAANLAKQGAVVTATDLNPRALELGRFSTRLCGVDGVDFRHGEGFEPVAGETFDLIVSNPPYVQSPGGQMTYKEARPGDPVCARLLGEIPRHLAPGGVAVVLINWSHASDEDWQEAPLSWVPEQGTRRWLFQTDCSSPAEYAWKWLSGDLRFQDEQAAMAELRRWLDFYRTNGIARVSGGFMVVQKCETGGEWTRVDSRAAGDFGSRGGVELLRVLANTTWLETGPDLLTACYTVPEGVRAEVGMALSGGGWERQTIRLTSPERLSYDGQVDENILRLLDLAREGKPPAAMVDELHARPELAGVPDLPDKIRGLVHELVRHGVLVPAGQSAATSAKSSR